MKLTPRRVLYLEVVVVQITKEKLQRKSCKHPSVAVSSPLRLTLPSGRLTWCVCNQSRHHLLINLPFRHRRDWLTDIVELITSKLNNIIKTRSAASSIPHVVINPFVPRMQLPTSPKGRLHHHHHPNLNCQVSSCMDGETLSP